MNKLIAYCGLDCEKCDAYIATKNDDRELREKTAKLWAELNHAPILPEHINCQGCRVEGVKTVFLREYVWRSPMCVKKRRCNLRRLLEFRKMFYRRGNFSEQPICFEEFERLSSNLSYLFHIA